MIWHFRFWVGSATNGKNEKDRLSLLQVAANIEAFRQGLRELGYIEGQNISIEFRSGEQSQLAQLANELVQQKVEVIVAAGPAAPAAMTTTDTIPIVFSFSGDPIEAGLIDSLARPGRNMTGITLLAFELAGKRLEILKEAVLRVSHAALLSSQRIQGEQRELRETQIVDFRLGQNHCDSSEDAMCVLGEVEGVPRFAET